MTVINLYVPNEKKPMVFENVTVHTTVVDGPVITFTDHETNNKIRTNLPFMIIEKL